MNKRLLLIGWLAASASPAFAADDPIAVRQTLMQNNASASAVARALAEGDLEYRPEIGRAVINAFAATGATLADYFPEGSRDPERSRAAESIWEDMEGFLAQVEAFGSAVASAAEAPIDDAEAFHAAIEPVLGRCGECHGAYRD